MKTPFALGDVRGVIFDLDGVLYRGSQALPGAREILTLLAERGVPYVALTNHSGKTSEAYAAKLAGMGLDIPEARIVSAAWATAAYLAREAPSRRVFVVGTDALREELARQGVRWADQPDIVVVGFVTDLAAAPLQQAIEHLLAGAELIATNPDALLPVPGGVVPECGPVTAFLERASGVRAMVIGKPNPWIVRLALERLGTRPEDTMIVGDTLETDIAAAEAAGLQASLVLTGNTPTPPEDTGQILVTSDLEELAAHFERA